MSTPIRYSVAEQPFDSLYERVVVTVGRARTRTARLRLALSSLFIAMSGIGSVIAVRATLEAARASGFSTFASLAFSDTSVIAHHAQEFFFSLLETLPGIELIAVLFAVSVFLVSLRVLVRALQGVSTYQRISHA